MKSPSIYMDQSAEWVFRPPIEHYTKLLLERFLPLFDDVDSEQERAAEALLEVSQYGDGDYGSTMEAVYEQSINHALMFMEMRTIFLTTCVAGLFHLFEKQVYRHLHKEFRHFTFKTSTGKPWELDRWDRAEEAIRTLHHRIRGEGQTLVEALDDTDLQELKEVANAVKHGKGRALRVLHERRAEVVDSARLEGDWTTGEFSVFNVGLSIKPDDVRRYEKALLNFWAVRGEFCKPPAIEP